MQRYEKVRVEANGKRSFRHRRPCRGSRTAAFPFSRRPVLPAARPASSVVRLSPPAVRLGIFPSAFLILPGPSAARPGPIRSCLLPPATPRLPPGPVPPGPVPPGPVPSGPVPSAAFPAACPGASGAFSLLPPVACPPSDPCPVLSAARSSLSPFLRPAVPFCPPPFLSVPSRPPGAPRGARPNILPIFHYFARILYFCETKK